MKITDLWKHGTDIRNEIEAARVSPLADVTRKHKIRVYSSGKHLSVTAVDRIYSICQCHITSAIIDFNGLYKVCFVIFF